MTTEIIISITKDGYSSKDEAAFALGGSNGMPQAKFEEVCLTPKGILARAMKGHTICHLFHHKGDSFVATGVKTTENYKGTQCIFIDFDGASCSMHDYISRLTTKPTIAYNTFGHMVYDKKTGKMPIKFRLIYCLNEVITTERMYHGYHDGLKKLLQEEAGDIIGWDYHNRAVAQCIFGSTTDGNREQYLNADAIYSKESLPFIDPGVEDGSTSKKERKGKGDSSTLINVEVTNDFLSLSVSDFIEKYKYLGPVRKYRTEGLEYNDFLHCYILPPDRRYAEYTGSYDYKLRKEVRRNHDRSSFVCGAAVRFHSIYGNTLTAEQLLLLLASYCLRHVELATWHPSGRLCWKERVIGIAASVISRDKYYYEPEHKNKDNNFYFVVDKIWCRKNGIDAQAYSKTIPMKREMLRVLPYWDFNKPDTVNYIALKKVGIEKGKNTMTRWRNEHREVLEEVLLYIESNSLWVRDGFEQFEQSMTECAKMLGKEDDTLKVHEFIRKEVSRHAKKVNTELAKYIERNGSKCSKTLNQETWESVSPSSKMQVMVRDLLTGVSLSDRHDRPTDYHYYQKYLFEKMQADHPRLYQFVTEVMLPERCKFALYEHETENGYTFTFPVRVANRAESFAKAFLKYMSFTSYKFTSQIVYNSHGYCADVILHTDVNSTLMDKSYVREAICYACFKERILLTTGTYSQAKKGKYYNGNKTTVCEGSNSLHERNTISGVCNTQPDRSSFYGRMRLDGRAKTKGG